MLYELTINMAVTPTFAVVPSISSRLGGVELLAAGVLGHGLGSLRDGVLGEFTREEEPH